MNSLLCESEGKEEILLKRSSFDIYAKEIVQTSTNRCNIKSIKSNEDGLLNLRLFM